MKLEEVEVPKDAEAQSKFLNRAMVAGWEFNCKCVDSGLETDENEIMFVAEIIPPKRFSGEFGTLFTANSYDDSTNQVSGNNLIEIISKACDHIAEYYNDTKQNIELSAKSWNVWADHIEGK